MYKTAEQGEKGIIRNLKILDLYVFKAKNEMKTKKKRKRQKKRNLIENQKRTEIKPPK